MESKETNRRMFYELVVKGGLDQSWEIWFAPLRLSKGTDASGTSITQITGPIEDQAALFGILGNIRDLGLNLISLNPVSSYER